MFDEVVDLLSILLGDEGEIHQLVRQLGSLVAVGEVARQLPIHVIRQTQQQRQCPHVRTPERGRGREGEGREGGREGDGR